MKEHRKMIESILVDEELHPIRQAAAKGDIVAMIGLASHIVNGKKTGFCLDTNQALCEAILDHPHLRDSPSYEMEMCKVLADQSWYLYEQGRIDEQECRRTQRNIYQDYMSAATELPHQEWNVTEMKRIMDWLYEDAMNPLESSK